MGGGPRAARGGKAILRNEANLTQVDKDGRAWEILVPGKPARGDFNFTGRAEGIPVGDLADAWKSTRGSVAYRRNFTPGNANLLIGAPGTCCTANREIGVPRGGVPGCLTSFMD